MQNTIILENEVITVARYDGSVLTRYCDIRDAFEHDAGFKLPYEHINYNQTLETCWLDGQPFQPFPNTLCEKILTELESTIEQQSARRRVEPTLEEVKAEKLGELNVAFVMASQSAHCLSSAGFEINADETANRNISSLIIAMEATGQETVQFCAFDNTFHAVTLGQLRTMQLEIIANAQAIYQQKWVLRERINTAETIEALDVIDITFEAETEEADEQTA